MELEYTDQAGIKHDLDIFQITEGEEVIFVIHRNGNYFLDPVKRDDEWIEVYNGPTERSKEYGALLDKLKLP